MLKPRIVVKVLLCVVFASTTLIAQTGAKSVAKKPASSPKPPVSSASVPQLGTPKELRDAKGNLYAWDIQPTSVILEAAKAGDPAAMKAYGDTCSTPEEKFQWHLKSAQAGYVPAMLSVWQAYQAGAGTTANTAEAQKWLDNAKANLAKLWAGTDGQAMDAVGFAYFTGAGTGQQPVPLAHIGRDTFAPNDPGKAPLPFDMQEGLKWVKHAADVGDVVAEMYWVHILKEGVSITKQGEAPQVLMEPATKPDEYMSLATKAAESGDPSAEVLFGANLVNEPAEKLVWLQKAADQGFTPAMTQMTQTYLAEGPHKDPKLAAFWLRKSIANGDMGALINFANYSCVGDIEKNGPLAIATFKYALTLPVHDEGQDWLRGTADSDLAQAYANGTCVQQDSVAAAHYFLELAKTSNQNGPYQVSSNAATLAGVVEFPNTPSGKNPKLGISLLQQLDDPSTPLGSLASKDVKAQVEDFLGQAYGQGKGVPQDAAKAANLFASADSGGNFDATLRLGACYENGIGVSKNPARAAELYSKAADRGQSWGMLGLATLYLNGNGVPKDEKRALDLYVKAANDGLPDAMNQVGIRYEQGQGTPKNQAKADEWYRNAADRGSAWGAFNLAASYYSGKAGNNKDPKQAFEWYSKAADLGLPDAMNSVGFMYSRGEGVSQDQAKAAEWYRKAADKGFAWGAYNLADCYNKGIGVPQDFTQAAKWYVLASNQGISAAYRELGKLYRDGKGVPQDLSLARSAFEKSAATGDRAEAALNLGDMYSAGIGGAADMSKAAVYYKQAADAGDARAQFAYGFLLEHGQGVAQNDALAARYYNDAAAQGHASAANNLGMMYAQGRGVPRDDEKALQFFQAAARNGDQSAATNAQQMASVVEQERQVRAAQQAAEQAQQAEAAAEQQNADRQQRIAFLQSEIDRLNQEAANWDSEAENASQQNNSNCANDGAYASLCNSVGNTIGTLGAAKARQNAANARQEAQNDLEEIQQLSGMEVQHVHIDTSYAGALQQQVNEHPVPTIEDTLAQQQTNLYATAAAAQQQKVAQQQAALAQQQARVQLQQSQTQLQQQQAAAAQKAAQQAQQSQQPPAAPPVTEGELIRAPNSPDVYVVQGGQRHHVPDPATLAAKWGGALVYTISQSAMNSIPVGDSIQPVQPQFCSSVSSPTQPPPHKDPVWGPWQFLGSSGVAVSVTRVDAKTLSWEFFNARPDNITSLNFNYTYVDADTGQNSTQKDLVPLTLKPGDALGGWTAYTANTRGNINIQITQMSCQ